MRFDLMIVVEFDPSRDLGAVAGELAEQVELADDAGFDGVFVGEHHATDEPYLNNEAVLAHLAEHVGSLAIGPGICLLPYHNPVRIAEFGATMDVLTGGQFRLGVGQGYREEEFAVFGVDRRTAVERLVEGVEVIRRLWTEDDVSYDGEHVRLDGVTIEPKPVQDPHPPVWIGASNESSIRRAARLADEWMGGHVPLPAAREQVRAYRDERARLGRDAGHVQLGREVYVAETTERALDVVREPLARKYRTYVDWNQDGVIEGDSFEAAWAELAEDRFVIGDPETVVAELDRYRREADVDGVSVRMDFPGLDPADVRASIERFGEAVIPELAG